MSGGMQDTGYRIQDVGYRFSFSRGNLCNFVVTNTGKKGDVKKWE